MRFLLNSSLIVCCSIGLIAEETDLAWIYEPYDLEEVHPKQNSKPRENDGEFYRNDNYDHEFRNFKICSYDEGNFYWISASYFYGWPSTRHLPPLLTSAPSGENPNFANPNTQIVYGAKSIGHDAQGFRLTAGVLWDTCYEQGIELRYTFFEDWNRFYFAGDETGNNVGRPFKSASFEQESSILVSGVDGAALNEGEFSSTSGHNFHLIDILGRYPICCSGYFHYGFIGGFQYGILKDSLYIKVNNIVKDSGNNNQVVLTTNSFDDFSVKNKLYSGVVGIRMDLFRECFNGWLEIRGAVGSLDREVMISGGEISTLIGQSPDFFDFGLFAQASNIGRHKDNQWVIIPEIDLGVAYDWCNWIGFNLGYSYFYFGEVAMAGDQVNLNIDFGGDEPKFELNTKHYHIHGFNIGFYLHF